jgi:hypothetical protein
VDDALAAFANDLPNLVVSATAITNVSSNAASSPTTNLYLSLHTAGHQQLLAGQTQGFLDDVRRQKIPAIDQGFEQWAHPGQ